MTRVARMLAEAQVATMLLTRLPAGTIKGDVPSLAEARWAYPVVGLPLGLFAYAVHSAAMGLGASAAISAILTILSLALLTGALHFDGLADFADGLGGGRDKAHCLEIMRDSRIGSYGTLALMLLVGLWVAALADIGSSVTLLHFLGVAMLSRAAMVVLLEWMPAAREDGLGKSASGTGRASGLALGGVIVFALLGLGWIGLGLVLVTAAIAVLVALAASRRIGGQTGDVLGATQALTEVGGWLFLSISLTF